MPKIKVTPEEIAAAGVEAAKKKGTGSFFLDILGAPLLKRPALSETVAKYRTALQKADIAAGEAAGKVPGLGRVLQEEIRTPVKTVGGLEVAQVRRVKRLTAPLVKSQRFLVPIFAYEGLRRILGGAEEAATKASGDTTMTRDEQAVLLKAAATIEKLGKEREALIGMLAEALHEKQASKIAREMAAKGMIASEDMEKKASELAKESDLGVIRKAVDLAERGFDLGKLEKRAAVDGVADGEEMDPMTSYLADYVRNGR